MNFKILSKSSVRSVSTALILLSLPTLLDGMPSAAPTFAPTDINTIVKATNVNNEDAAEHIGVYIAVAVGFVLLVVILMCWARHNYEMEKERLYSNIVCGNHENDPENPSVKDMVII